MRGANEYASLFSTGFYGQFYIISGSHARGKTFHIYVVPEGTETFDHRVAVEVYGIISGNPGWTESYGWLYKGEWVEDFEEMVKKRNIQNQIYKGIDNFLYYLSEKSKKDHIERVLNSYRSN